MELKNNEKIEFLKKMNTQLESNKRIVEARYGHIVLVTTMQIEAIMEAKIKNVRKILFSSFSFALFSLQYTPITPLSLRSSSSSRRKDRIDNRSNGDIDGIMTTTSCSTTTAATDAAKSSSIFECIDAFTHCDSNRVFAGIGEDLDAEVRVVLLLFLLLLV